MPYIWYIYKYFHTTYTDRPYVAHCRLFYFLGLGHLVQLANVLRKSRRRTSTCERSTNRCWKRSDWNSGIKLLLTEIFLLDFGLGVFDSFCDSSPHFYSPMSRSFYSQNTRQNDISPKSPKAIFTSTSSPSSSSNLKLPPIGSRPNSQCQSRPGSRLERGMMSPRTIERTFSDTFYSPRSPRREDISPKSQKLPPLAKSVSNCSINSCDSWESTTSRRSQTSDYTTTVTSSSKSVSGDAFNVPIARIHQLEKSQKYRRPSSPSDRLFQSQNPNLLKTSLTPKAAAELFWEYESECMALPRSSYPLERLDSIDR